MSGYSNVLEGLRWEDGRKRLEAAARAAVAPQSAARPGPAATPLVLGDKRRGAMLQLVQRAFLLPGRPLHRVLFCGVDGNGSSEVCAGAAVALAEQTGEQVCVIDGNLKQAPLSKIFGLEGAALTVAGQEGWRAQCFPAGGSLVVGGTALLAGPDGRLAPASELRRRIASLAVSFAYLLVDAPGAQDGPDAAMLGQVLGSAILTLQTNATRKALAREAKEKLELASVKVVGAVMT